MILEIIHPDGKTRKLTETDILPAAEWAREMGLVYQTLQLNASDAGFKTPWVRDGVRRPQYPASFLPALVEAMGKKVRPTKRGADPFYFHPWATGVRTREDFEVTPPSGNTFRFRHSSQER